MKPKPKFILFSSFSAICLSPGFAFHNSFWSLWLLIGGTVCAAFALYYHLMNHRTHGIEHWQARNWSILLCGAGLLGVIFYWREYKHPIREYPHFGFSLHTADTLEDNLQLTNSFLVFGLPTTNPPSGDLLIPSDSESPNLILRIIVKNDSRIFADNVLVTVCAPATWTPNPESGWIWAYSDNHFEIENGHGGTTTNKMQAWAYHVPHPILDGMSQEIPALTFSHFPPLFTNKGPVLILARSKDSPINSVMFNVLFVSTNLIRGPVVALSKTTNGTRLDDIPKSILK